MRTRVRIDRVILDGVPIAPAQASRVRAALEAELGRLLADRGWPGGAGDDRRAATRPESRDERSEPRNERRAEAPRGGAIDRLQGPEVRVSRDQPAATGRRLAAAVYRSLGGVR
jgi:hypothetical protein